MLIREAGFSDVMLWWGDEMDEINGPKEKLADKVRNYGLNVENVHLPYIEANLLWEEGINGDELLEKYALAVSECAERAIKTIVIHLTYDSNPPPVSNIGLERMKRLCDTAARAGVCVAAENVEADAHLEAVFAEIDSERLKFCYDSGHEHCKPKRIDYLGRYGSRLGALHLHDNDGTADQHLIPGCGGIAWAEIISKLSFTGYNGAVSLEAFSPDGDEHDARSYLKYAYIAARGIADTLDSIK